MHSLPVASSLILLLVIPLVQQAPIPATADADAATQLAAGYIDDPAATLTIARRVAASSDPAARDVFVDWVHYVLAREFVPTFTANAVRVRPLLDGLAEWTDAGGFTVHVTAGLRSWAQALDAKDAETLKRLADISYERAESYGGRYRLLIARLLDDREEPDLQARARGMRERLLFEIREKLQGFPRPAFDQPYGVTLYWSGLALSREAELCRRAAAQEKDRRTRNDLLGNAAMHSHNAGTATGNAVRRPDTWWLREAAVLRGPDEFLTADAALDEERAREFAAAGRSGDAAFTSAQALRRLAEATLVDGALFPLFEKASARLRPGISWAKVWCEGILQHASALPLSSDKRWRILFVWDPGCRTCDATIRSVGEMIRESPDGVLIGTSRQHRDAAIAHLPARGVEVTPVIVPDDVFSKLSTATVPYLVAPDGRYERLSLRHWEPLARAFLTVLPEKP